MQFGTSSRVSTRRASTAVSTTAKPGHRSPRSWQAIRRKPTSNGALCATSTLPAANSRKAGQHHRDRRRAADHRVGDAGEHAHERRDPDARVDQRLELAEHLAAAHLDRADLGDPVVPRAAAGRLEVDDGERRLAQRLVQLVQAQLLEPTTR